MPAARVALKICRLRPTPDPPLCHDSHPSKSFRIQASISAAPQRQREPITTFRHSRHSGLLAGLFEFQCHAVTLSNSCVLILITRTEEWR